MLKAKLDSVRKNKKGFSLVELIIVIAIMVALIAVMAPSFVKYVQKSRDAALTSAAEDFYTGLKTYFSDPDVSPKTTTNSSVTIKVGNDKHIDLANSGFNADDWAEILKVSGVDSSKSMGATSKQYKISVSFTSGKEPTFLMEDISED